MTESSSPKKVAIEFLETSEAEWNDLVKSGVAHHLVHLIPLALAYQDDLEAARKFFIEVKELSIPPKIDAQLDVLDKLRIGITAVVEDSSLEPPEAIELLDSSMEGLEQSYTKYAKLEADTINGIKTNSKRPPAKEAFVDKIRSYWNYIDDFWSSEGNSIIGKWNKYFEETGPSLKETASSLRLGSVPSPHSVLIRVESLLKKRYSHFMASKVADALDRVKNYQVEELGLIPAYMGAKGNWKVVKDDCPNKALPERQTLLTDKFAFCRKDDKECSSFDWSQGSYVRCKSFTRLKEAELKEARLLESVKLLDDSAYVNQLKLIAETDPFVQMLFTEASRRSGELFWGKVIDERLEQMLEQYPKSNRRGEFEYKVYMVSNEPVVVSGNFAVAADKTLLETIGEGERMPKNASTLRIAGPVMRITFTANAVRDPQFRDFLRKKNARKSGHFTYEIPFDREEEINFCLSEIRSEFGYKVEIFQIMEDADEFVEKDFGVYRYTDFPISVSATFRLAMTYIPKVKNRKEMYANSMSLPGAEKLVDLANNLGDKHPLHARVARLASRLRTGGSFFVATESDMIRYASGAVGVIPEVGTRWMVEDPDSGDQTMVEMVKAVRSGSSIPKYQVRRVDNGKEIILKRPWIAPTHEGCGGDMMPAPIEGPPQGPGLPGPAVMGPDMPPGLPFGHIVGEDDLYYIVQVPKNGPMGMNTPSPEMISVSEEQIAPEGFPSPAIMPEPPPYGRFPGDVTLSVPPRMETPALFPSSGANPISLPSFSGQPPATEMQGPELLFQLLTQPQQEVDFAENEILEDVQEKTQGLKVPGRSSDPKAPSGAEEDEVNEAIKKLKELFKGDPRVKEVRRDLNSKGKPVLYLHSTMPKSIKKETPDSINGFEIILAPLHDSLKDAKSKKDDADVTADSLVNPLPNRPQNGKVPKREIPPGPYLDQVSGPPPMGDVLVTQVRDIPKGR